MKLLDCLSEKYCNPHYLTDTADMATKKVTTKEPNLTTKQESWIDNMIKTNGNATQAAIMAGYSKNVAAEMGCKNLRKPHIMNALSKKLEPVIRRREIGNDRIIGALAALAFTPLDHIVDYGPSGVRLRNVCDMSPAARLAAKKVTMKETIRRSKEGEEEILTRTVSMEIHDKQRALDCLARINKMYDASSALAAANIQVNILLENNEPLRANIVKDD